MASLIQRPPIQVNRTDSGPFYRSNTPQERSLNSDLRVSLSAYDYQGIYATPPSYADQPVCLGLSNPIAPLETLPGPSFEDLPPSPPPPPIASSLRYRKIYESRPDGSPPPPEVAHRSYTREHGISYYYPPHQGMGQAQRFDGALKEVRISGRLERLGQRGLSGSDSHQNYCLSWVAQLQEESRRRPIRKRS